MPRYTFVEMTCVWDYGDNHRKGVFREFVDRFYKIKTEAAGYPNDCATAEEKQKYMRDFEKREGIKLDPAAISHNPGKKACGKILLNSCWGKWVQNMLERWQTKFFHASVTFHRFVNSPEYTDIQVRLINAETAIAEGRPVAEMRRPYGKGNVVLGVVTTAWAHLKLLSILEDLGERVLYYDTDSVFYRMRTGDSEPASGTCLGELSDIFKGECTRFVGLGTKDYAFRTNADATPVMKVRGITFNRTSSLIVNFDYMFEQATG